MKFSFKDLTARFASLLGGQEEKPEEAKPVETAEATTQNDEDFHAWATGMTKAIEKLATQMSNVEAVAQENASVKTTLASVQSELANLKKMPAVAETAVSGVVENLPTKPQDAFSEEVNQRIESLKYAENQLEMYRKAGLV